MRSGGDALENLLSYWGATLRLPKVTPDHVLLQGRESGDL